MQSERGEFETSYMKLENVFFKEKHRGSPYQACKEVNSTENRVELRHLDSKDHTQSYNKKPILSGIQPSCWGLKSNVSIHVVLGVFLITIGNDSLINAILSDWNFLQYTHIRVRPKERDILIKNHGRTRTQNQCPWRVTSGHCRIHSFWSTTNESRIFIGRISDFIEIRSLENNQLDFGSGECIRFWTPKLNPYWDFPMTSFRPKHRLKVIKVAFFLGIRNPVIFKAEYRCLHHPK